MLNEEGAFAEIAKSRPYSRFICQEMLFDYLLGRLDPMRKKAVESALEKHDDLKKRKRSLEVAINYCNDLSQCELGEAFLNKAMAPLTIMDVLKHRFSPRRWPVPLKWGLEALVVSSLVATITLVLFWSNIQSMIPVRNETVLIQQKIKKEEFNLELTDKKEIADFNEKMSVETPEEKAPEVTTPVTVAKIEPANVKPALPVTTVAPVTVAPRPPAPVAPTPTPTPTPTVAVAVAAAIAPKPAPKPKGYVYKLVMSLVNLELLGPEIAEKIIAMGAIKAGEVEIGWRKPNGNYYHFVIEKEKGTELLEMLQAYGPIEKIKDSHGRVMPENQDRYILWIEDK